MRGNGFRPSQIGRTWIEAGAEGVLAGMVARRAERKAGLLGGTRSAYRDVFSEFERIAATEGLASVIGSASWRWSSCATRLASATIKCNAALRDAGVVNRRVCSPLTLEANFSMRSRFVASCPETLATRAIRKTNAKHFGLSFMGIQCLWLASCRQLLHRELSPAMFLQNASRTPRLSKYSTPSRLNTPCSVGKLVKWFVPA
jgi:hypothetical protein